jgi:hypothetical protein
MSKSPQVRDPGTPLRLYSTPWKGEPVFACLKCQRKLKKGKGLKALRKVAKWFRKRGSRSAERPPVSVIGISCVDLCPKNGVTIFSARQLVCQRPAVRIVRSESDLEQFYCELTDTALFPENDTAK